MYDMYPWHRADASNDDTARASGSPSRGNVNGNGTARPGRPASPRPASVAAGAVQVALDRRDNGGDPGQSRGE